MTDKPKTHRERYTLLIVRDYLELIAELSSDKKSRDLAKRALAYVKELLP